jgi:hypothetical protein
MAIDARRYQGGPLSGWLNVVGETYASITDVTIQNQGEADAYLSLDANWGNVFMILKGGQMVGFEGLSFADASRLYVSDDGNGTTIGIVEISR